MPRAHCLRSPLRASLHRSGVTLIEVLVVVGVIVLLSAVLLPAIGTVRRLSQQVSCAAQLRQLGVAVQLYHEDSRGRYLAYWMSPTDFWMSRLMPYHDDINRMRYCPTARRQSARSDYAGSATTGWGPEAPPQVWLCGWEGSYGYNEWLNGAKTSFASWHGGSWAYGNRRWPPASAAHVPMISDSIWVNQWPERSHQPPADLLAGSTQPTVTMQRVCIDRHRRGVNTVFADGHVDRVRLAGLWDLAWRDGDTALKPTVLPQ